MKIKKQTVVHIDQKVINFFRHTHLLIARLSLFIVFFWFGALKLLDLSPASPLAQALTEKTVGLEWFDLLFTVIAALECVIGVLFLFPKYVRVTMMLLLFHMGVVCAPLLLVPEITWQSAFVPSLEGQYIIKNAVVIAVAFGIAAHTQPLKLRNK